MYGNRKMNKTVMIVDDNQRFHDTYKAMLENSDYEVISVCNEEEALSKLKEKKPDLVIINIY